MKKGNHTLNRRLWVPLLALALVAVGVVATVWQMHGPAKEEGYVYTPARGDTIDVAIAYSPMSLYRYGDTLGGLNYEILRTMAAMYGDNIKVWPVTAVTDALRRLEKGDYDVLIADIPVTASLRERVRFTVPVYTDNLVLVSRDGALTSPLELAGRRVWAVAGTPAYERLLNLEREIGDTISIHATDSYTAEQLVMLVAAGDVPRAVVNREVAHRLRDEHPGLKVTADVSLTQFQSWMLNLNDSVLADTLDAQITRFKATAAYDSLMAKWTCR